MSEKKEEKHPIEKFKSTVLLNIDAGKSTLPIDTAAEWNKGYVLINEVIYRLYNDTYTEDFIDEIGEKRKQTHIHNQLLPFLQERRRMQEQIWKLMGGEAVVEGQKQVMRNIADMIFNIGKDPKLRESNKDKIKEIIETEFNNE